MGWDSSLLSSPCYIFYIFLIYVNIDVYDTIYGNALHDIVKNKK